MNKPRIRLQIADKRLKQALESAFVSYLPVTRDDGLALPDDRIPDDRIIVTDESGADADPRVFRIGEPPWRLGRVLDRIGVLLRRTDLADIAFGPFTLSGDETDLRGDGKTIRLTEKEAALLRRLHGADGPMERAALLADIWGYGEGLDTHTLETHVYRLRQKIEENPAEPRWLLTDGAGYRLAR